MSYKKRHEYTKSEHWDADIADLTTDLRCIDEHGKTGPEWDAYREKLQAQIARKLGSCPECSGEGEVEYDGTAESKSGVEVVCAKRTTCSTCEVYRRT